MSGPRNAEDRLRRLLVMLPWLMEVGEVPLADVARRYDLTEAQVQTDLELVAMCGLPPFVDEMVDVFVDEGMVYVGVPRLFTRPLRLTAPEGFTLLAAGRAAMELPGADPDGPLGRGLDKLAAVLGEAGLAAGSDNTAGVVIDLARPAIADDLAEAAAAGRELSISYYTPARDEVGDRVIVPRHVFVDSGHWYVLADDDRSGQRRTFRIDRIESAEPTGMVISADDPAMAPDRFFVDAEVPRVSIRLGPSAQWVVEEYPIDAVTELSDPPGWIEVRLPVASERWLAKLLIRLGPNAVTVDPEAATAARRTRPPGTGRLQRHVERRELRGVGDAVGSEEMGEDLGGGGGITQCIVRPIEGDVVAGAHIGEPVRLFSRRVEPSRHPQRAQQRAEAAAQSIVGRPTAGGAGEKGRVEGCVVRGEDRTVESLAQLVERVAEQGGVLQMPTRDAVDVGGADSLQRPAQLDVARPCVDDGAVGGDGDQTDLEHPMAARRQPGGLQVDDGERGKRHVGNPRQRVSQPVFRGRVRKDRPAGWRRRCGQPASCCSRARTPMGADTVKPARWRSSSDSPPQ